MRPFLFMHGELRNAKRYQLLRKTYDLLNQSGNKPQSRALLRQHYFVWISAGLSSSRGAQHKAKFGQYINSCLGFFMAVPYCNINTSCVANTSGFLEISRHVYPNTTLVVCCMRCVVLAAGQLSIIFR